MYLSRLILNPRSGRVRRDLADCHQLHRTVMAAFPELVPSASAPAARARLGVLYRLDTQPRTGHAILLIQSAAQPDWSGLPDGYLLPVQDGQANPAVKPVADAYAAIRAGDRLLFRLRANPTKRLPPSTGPDGVRRDGKRVELRTEEDQIAWLQRKAGASGFDLLSVRARPGLPDVRPGYQPSESEDVRAIASKIIGRRPRSGSADAAVHDRLTLGDVLFEGRLRVITPDLFRQTLERGIGPAKAYGFGLLSVAPTR